MSLPGNQSAYEVAKVGQGLTRAAGDFRMLCRTKDVHGSGAVASHCLGGFCGRPGQVRVWRRVKFPEISFQDQGCGGQAVSAAPRLGKLAPPVFTGVATCLPQRVWEKCHIRSRLLIASEAICAGDGAKL